MMKENKKKVIIGSVDHCIKYVSVTFFLLFIYENITKDNFVTYPPNPIQIWIHTYLPSILRFEMYSP